MREMSQEAVQGGKNTLNTILFYSALLLAVGSPAMLVHGLYSENGELVFLGSAGSLVGVGALVYAFRHKGE